MSRYWWLYLIALIALILIGVTTNQIQKIYEEHKVNDERIVEDTIAGRLQMIIMQNDSIFNTLQIQSRLDTINIKELRGIRRELIKSNKRK